MHRKLQAILFLKLLTKFQYDAQNKSYDDFPQVIVWNVIRESAKTLTSLDHISANIARQALKFGPEV